MKLLSDDQSGRRTRTDLVHFSDAEVPHDVIHRQLGGARVSPSPPQKGEEGSGVSWVSQILWFRILAEAFSSSVPISKVQGNF
ncbi:hypothetical protein U1Q18_023471 [Sarracenia purpurea var. burkii]